MGTPTRRELRDSQPKRRLSGIRKLGDILLTLLAVASAVVLLVMGAGLLGIVTPLVVTSNSMQPTFSAGDLIIARPAVVTSLEVGDIVTAPRPDGVLVTHRVVSLHGDSFTMQGDANNSVDAEPYTTDEVLVPLTIIPQAGSIVAALNNSKFIITSIVGLVILVWAAFMPTKRKVKDDVESP